MGKHFQTFLLFFVVACSPTIHAQTAAKKAPPKQAAKPKPKPGVAPAQAPVPQTSPGDAPNLSPAERLELEAIHVGDLARRRPVNVALIAESRRKSQTVFDEMAGRVETALAGSRMGPDEIALKVTMDRAATALVGLTKALESRDASAIQSAASTYSEAGAVFGSMLQSLGGKGEASVAMEKHARACFTSPPFDQLIMMANAGGQQGQAQHLLDLCIFNRLTGAENDRDLKAVQQYLPSRWRALKAANDRQLLGR
jgi:hypothetical protein